MFAPHLLKSAGRELKDNVAADGTERNGTYTEHLLRYIKQPGLPLPDLFSEVGRALLQETSNKLGTA